MLSFVGNISRVEFSQMAIVLKFPPPPVDLQFMKLHSTILTINLYVMLVIHCNVATMQPLFSS